MPRNTMEIEGSVEYLSILDEDGNLDEELQPDLPDELLKRMFRAMIRARRFDERRLQLQRQGRIGTFAPGRGQEASQVGAVAALEESDWTVPSFRETAASLWRGIPLSGILLFDAGYNEGGKIPDEINELPVAVPVGTQVPHAVGLAHGLGFQSRSGDDPPVVLTFFGDGATSQGDFHESLNWAQILTAPVVFLCQNNQWAISVPRDQQTRSDTLAQKAVAYGMPGVQVDGNDVFAVYQAVREAADRAREGEGPTLVECVTYRLTMHTTADDPSRYRSEEEVERWEKRDPVPRLRDHLQDCGLLEEGELESMEEELEEEIDAAWEETKETIKGLPGAETMFEHIYADSPAYLEEQREAMSRDRASRKSESSGHRGRDLEEEAPTDE